MAAETEKFVGTTRKVTAHLTQNEGLSFEKSAPGKKAYRLAALDVPEADAKALLGEAAREDAAGLPELSEIEIIRHFTRLSTWNYAIDLGMYPLGSCTMKYNPRVNEFVSRLEGIAEAHPYQPESLSQGSLGIIRLLQKCLLEITGMEAITLQPAAGAHGEFTGILLARAYHTGKGQSAAQRHHSRLGARDEPGHRGHLRIRGREFQVERERRDRCRGARAGGE
jgi:glycine dehydrogenase subunit 2